MRSGHRSHQNGLDMDIFFGQPKGKPKTESAFPKMVTAQERIDESEWKPHHIYALKSAAQSPEVARIFVNWVIKQQLCAQLKEERAWLAKIRPWYGHDRHFHIRLSCPEGSPECREQEAPKGEGCGEEIWFSRAEVLKRQRAKKKSRAKIKKRSRPSRPQRCREIKKAK